MVLVTAFKEHIKEDGTSFYSLILEGGFEIVENDKGEYIGTTKRAYLPCTFGREMCEALIGKKIEGKIITKLLEEPIQVIVGNKKVSIDYKNKLMVN